MSDLIGYYTENNVSHAVMEAFAKAGIKTHHIKNFYENKGTPSIFYGILRGSGMAMRWCKAQGIDFWYVDNGYFDAIYMDHLKRKSMDGKFRIVKNQLIEPYTGIPNTVVSNVPMNLLILPPSPYTAFMNDTMPEDWLQEWLPKLGAAGHHVAKREKEDKSPFVDQVSQFGAVFAFNSMAVVKAMDMGRAVYTTHGIVRNADMIGHSMPYYNIDDLQHFYEDKQFTLGEIKERGLECLSA